MAYNHETIRKFESTEFPGVTVHLYTMTEGRRLKLRSEIAESNRRLREIIREQGELTEAEGDKNSRDAASYMELQDEFDGIVLGTMNPAWIKWGVKRVDGLEADGKTLDVCDWADWPSLLTQEILEEVKSEAELNGADRKNSQSPTTSPEVKDGQTRRLTAESAKEKDSGETEIVPNTSPIM